MSVRRPVAIPLIDGGVRVIFCGPLVSVADARLIIQVAAEAAAQSLSEGD